MKLNKISKYAASALVAVGIFTGCGGGGTSAGDVTYSGTVDLSPIYKMLVYVGSDYNTSSYVDNNESTKPSRYTFTDINGSYNLSAPKGSTISIVPIDGLTEVEGKFFRDLNFVATTSSTNSKVVMSDAKKAILPTTYTQSQLLSLYGVDNKDDMYISDLNMTNMYDANRTVYKEIRDSQDFALKMLFKSYLTSEYNLTSTEQTALDKDLDKYILQSWLDVSQDSNISLDDEVIIQKVATKVINKYNDKSDNDISNSQITTELKEYSAFICTSISTDLLNSSETNATKKINMARSLYAGVVSELENTIKETGKLIYSNTTASQNNKALAPTLFSLYVKNYLEEGK
jgi:LysM repeat protein